MFTQIMQQSFMSHKQSVPCINFKQTSNAPNRHSLNFCLSEPLFPEALQFWPVPELLL